MIHERLEENAALYAVGALTADETAAFEAEIAEDNELASLVAELQETAAGLAYTAPARFPPVWLVDRILAQVRDGDTGAPTDRFSWARWVPWAIAAFFAVLAGGMAFDTGNLKRRLSQSQSQAASLAKRDFLANVQIASLTSQLENAPAIAGAIARDQQAQRGLLTLQKLPKLTPTQDYQLWVIVPQYPQTVSAGLVEVGPDGTARILFQANRPYCADRRVCRQSRG